MSHGMSLKSMTTEITQEQVHGLYHDAKKAFLDGLEEHKRYDLLSWSEDFGSRSVFSVWLDSKFYISDHGVLRALQPNDTVMMWDTEGHEWVDNELEG